MLALSSSPSWFWNMAAQSFKRASQVFFMAEAEPDLTMEECAFRGVGTQVCVLVIQSCPFCDPMGVAHQAPLSVEFFRQEYQSGLPCPPPGDLPDPGIEPGSPALAGRFFTI